MIQVQACAEPCQQNGGSHMSRRCNI